MMFQLTSRDGFIHKGIHRKHVQDFISDTEMRTVKRLSNILQLKRYLRIFLTKFIFKILLNYDWKFFKNS